ncbi:MAG: alpha/beta hydrolase [Symbiobacteriia bacterium]
MGQSYRELRDGLIQLYAQGEYQKALDILERESPRFPEEAWDSYYFRLCLEARLDHPQQAMAYLSEALDQGLWYPVDMLREDLDLQPLQELPAFDALVERSRQKGEEQQAAAKPTRLVLQPDAPHSPTPLLIALHGNGRNAKNSAPHWAPLVAEGWSVVLPQSSQMAGNDAYVWNDRPWAIREIKQHMAAATHQLNADPARLLIGGFSMGAGVAGWMALTGEVAAQGFILVGPWINEVDELRRALEGHKIPQMRGYIVVGDADEHCYEVSKEIAAIMKEQGLECELEVHPGMGHVFPEDFEVSLGKALDFIFGR